MKRRDLIRVAGLVSIGSRVGQAQPPLPVVGLLDSGTAVQALLDAFIDGLASMGYREGKNVSIDYRWAEGHYDRLPALVAGLVQRPVDVLVTTGGAVAAQAAKAGTNTIPIAALSGGDFVAMGLASSLNRPGGNVTGIAQLVAETDTKRLQLLHELAPAANRIAYLTNPASPGSPGMTQRVMSWAHTTGLPLSVEKASSEGGLVDAFETMSQGQIDALLVGADPFFFMQREQIAALAARHVVPTMYFFREFSTAGGLISYGTRLAVGYRQIGICAGKILRGANPAELPIVQQSEKIELVLNLKTAKALGLTVPPSILGRADEIIE